MKVDRTLLLTHFYRYSYVVELHVQYEGTCCPAVTCQDFKDPVCDSERVTHQNECFFNAVECIRKKTENITITIRHKGFCEECSTNCDDLPLPVCDEVNETHKSLCKLEEFNCRLKAFGHEPRKVKHVGKCRKQGELVKIAAGARIVNSDELTRNFPEKATTVPAASDGGYGSDEDQDVFSSGESPLPSVVAKTTFDPQPDKKETVCSAALCTKNRDPVCDNRNKTHLNMCLFEFAACKNLRFGVQLEIAHKGECSKQKLVKVPRRVFEETEVVPVCDNFNRTHQSICLFSKWNCERRRANKELGVLVHVGPCHAGSPLFNLKVTLILPCGGYIITQEEVCPTKCSRDYRPVCDSHGTTHPNLCTFQMYNCKARKANVDDVAFLTTLHECKEAIPKHSKTTSTTRVEEKRVASANETFECPEPHCDNIKSPVCDSEGHVHKNECLFAWARCLAAQQGRTLRIMPDESCNIANCRVVKSENCTNDYDPVCGSDFVTYPNFCVYQKAQCAQRKLEILFKGECSACLVKPCPHLEPESDDDLFVCDQAGETKSKCEFDMLRCIYEKKFGYNITNAYVGRCCERMETCPTESKPLLDVGSKRSRDRNRRVWSLRDDVRSKQHLPR
uniref:Kazal-like domain-containing protein n=1 Tax=Steinernema glaseri TaxID=37863 RepID=A0A1I7ZJ00_9BILA